MQKLNRGPSPACLGRYRHGSDQWSNTSPSLIERGQIWTCLDAMQGDRCAYCEAALQSGDKHIEHFKQRARHPAGTFDWSNLFGSCNRIDTCGKHKDTCGHYDPDDLIKPDVDDPGNYFVFVSDGTIVPRLGLQPLTRRRAEETLRVFNLDTQYGALRHMRRQAVAGYLQTAEEFRQFAAEFDETEWRPLLDQELASISHLPFVTAIRHALLGSCL